MPQTALKYDLEVTQNGRVELPVPFQVGAHLTVFVISEQASDNFDELLAASQSRLDFWDNPFDDEDWNHVRRYCVNSSSIH
jgi:hypothetical protein